MRITPWMALALSLAACSTPKKSSQTTSATPSTDPASQMVQDLAALEIDKLGNPVLRWDSIPPVLATKERPHKLMVLLVEYQDRGFDRFKGDADQGDKLASWYQEQLFDDSYERVNTLSHYYKSQSLGAYHVSGTVLPPVKLSNKREHYGSPYRPAGGSWRDDAEPEGLVGEAINIAKTQYPDLDWSDYDRWDPQDIDKDGNLDEPDGYLDHFVVVFAGGGQSSCEGLHKVRKFLTTNVGMEALAQLTPEQKECADRIWPHRSRAKANDGRGPTVAGKENPDGGLPVNDQLWVRDYNMQSEYTASATFIHEFGHSIGLPDVYSRTSSNSTGGWEVMSGTASPSPQNLSAWSRLNLGWLKPQVILPPTHGGKANEVIKLITLDDPAGTEGDATRSALIILPPRERKLELTELPAASGTMALYSGQGNELNRKATLSVDLKSASGPVELSFDAWWDIEAGWDFAYLEVSGDGGQSWTRKTPTEAAHMPAKHGHDGKSSIPGFTGFSGDLDGDGKNESAPGCDPKAPVATGEDQVGAEKNPCLQPSWVRPAFDLSDMAGKDVLVRLRYYTDGAAVQRGIMIDNVAVTGVELSGDFESESSEGWKLEGFSRSPGHHDLLVPHFYLVEYRDPYAKEIEGHHRYDSALAKTSTLLYNKPGTEDMMAVQIKNRPGVVVWYYNGEFAWSENDPAINGPGKGYLLALDANTSELPLPGLEGWFKGSGEANDTHYDVKSDEAQKALMAAYAHTVCFVRDKSYLPSKGVDEALAKSIGCGEGKAPVLNIKVDGKPLRYSYEIINELLPGEAREAFSKASELVDTKATKDGLVYRLRDRALRSLHTKDNPLSAEPFEDALQIFKVGKDSLELIESRPFPAQPRFEDSKPEKFLNAKLPFGGVKVPSYGLNLEAMPTSVDESGRTTVELRVDWNTGASDAAE